jgi:hypothetical protein
VLASGLAMGLVWTAATAATIWPQGLCYVNDFWGGSKHGCELVSDSNYDWGQGLPELAAWQRRHGGEPVDVWYFGTDPAIKTLPVRYLPLQILKVNEPADLLEHTQGRFLAVSTTMLYGATTDRAHRIAAEFLRTCPPAARTTTFVIYDCRELGERSRRQPRTETVDE